MSFLCELALALSKSLAEVWALSAAEISIWVAYRNAHGFPVDREQGATAIGAAYVGGCFGGKAKPTELVPRFGVPVKVDTAADLEAVKAWFDARGK